MQLADPERFVEKVRELYQQPDKSSFDQIEFADGRLFERYSQPQRIEANIVGRVWSFRDITGRKRAEEEKAKLEEQYRQAQKMEAIGQLAGGVAHDFNNMLNIILGYSQMALMKTDPSSQLSANLMEIMNAARRSADLVRQLLAFARKQTIAPKALDLNDTIAGMLNMLRKLIGEDINLIWMPAANLWQVKMDPAQIDQILANLAVNARDSISGVGKITIETGNAQFDKEYCSLNTDFVPGQYVLLSVSDNGCGMDKETCEQIFEPFFTTKEVGKGTGMGLATVYGIVKQNSGFIKVQSEPGKGTTFRIYLPRREEEAGTAINEPYIHSGPLTGTEMVLLVEDNEALLKMGKMMLEELGYGVLTAGTPDEAVKLVEQYAGDIHLVLTDVVMPGMNGRDLMNRLSLLRPGIKGLFMSGYTSNVIAHRGILDEGVYFIQKPFHMEVLASRIRDALLATDSSHVNSDPKFENKGR
jgi:signal transduction histidine kinase/ActR/RegA family two-component response regulator